MEAKIIITGDGSPTLFVPEIRETYHSFHGAFQESMHVFINNGCLYFLEQHPQKPVSILEIGFGTGLNVLLTISVAILSKVKINFTTLEPFPLDSSIISQLNYNQQLEEKIPNASVDYQELYKEIHSGPWNEKVQIHEDVTLDKRNTTIENFSEKGEKFDLIYFDAFAPNKQPELWTLDILKKTYFLMSKGGFLVTYCAQGQFKRNLKTAGFFVETLKGPPGKKEMVRAGKV
ncbi:tRNA (5-methylaminomethyl-2-thiouridine)(34)-methyltransferase MnmD [soil metagenome]